MKIIKINALISISGLILFLIIVMCLHFLRPDKNMLSCFVSEYAVGKNSWLMTIAFYALSLASTLLLFGLSLQVNSSFICKITLGLFSIGILFAGVFPTDVPGFAQTTAGFIHGFAALIALLSLGISIIAWGISFKNNHEFKKFARPSVLWGLTSLILLIIFIGSPIGLRGLTQRLLLVCDISWLLLISLKLYRFN
jgi:hypothetical protein